MNYIEILNMIRETASAQTGVYSVYDGNAYDNWNSAEVQYGSVNIGLQNVTYNGNLVTYTFVLYYADRLLQNDKNVNNIYNDGVRILQSTVNAITSDGETFVDSTDILVYTPFKQKFMDYLAGVYVTVDLTCESELGRCDIDDFDEENNDDENTNIEP